MANVHFNVHFQCLNPKKCFQCLKVFGVPRQRSDSNGGFLGTLSVFMTVWPFQKLTWLVYMGTQSGVEGGRNTLCTSSNVQTPLPTSHEALSWENLAG